MIDELTVCERLGSVARCTVERGRKRDGNSSRRCLPHCGKKPVRLQLLFHSDEAWWRGAAAATSRARDELSDTFWAVLFKEDKNTLHDQITPRT